MEEENVVRAAEMLQRKNLSAQVYDILEKRILTGDIPPGASLAEESAAEEFGISRSPVREAISALEQIGLAERGRGRDRRVVIPSAKFIADTYDAWTILEAGRCYLSSLAATAEDHDEIRRALSGMEKAKRAHDLAIYSELSRRFHHLLKCRCDNVQILSVFNNFEKYRQWLVALYHDDTDTSESTMKEHREIAKRYIEKDLAGLTASIQRHIAGQKDRVLASMTNRKGAAIERAAR
ncbi:MAG: FCD domain-containing protein [Rhodospirillales bacterium]|nr:FCD domain-containing protein [Rhodospirillales bacterium]